MDDITTTILASFNTVIIAMTAIFIFFQVKQMKLATIAQAFSTILLIIQAPDRKEARKTLTNIETNDLNKWTTKERDDAEFACSTYDAVGILLQKKVIEHEMVTKEWQYSIISCWDKAKPLIDELRDKRGKDYWNDFEWLYNEAKK